MSMSILLAFVCKIMCEFRENTLFFTYWSQKNIYFSHLKVRESRNLFPKDALNPGVIFSNEMKQMTYTCGSSIH